MVFVKKRIMTNINRMKDNNRNFETFFASKYYQILILKNHEQFFFKNVMA